MEEIVSVHHPKIKKKLLAEALECFFELREIPGLKNAHLLPNCWIG